MKELLRLRTFRFVCTLAIILSIPGLGLHSIYILDEAKNATCAREMLTRSDLIVPTFNAELRTDKPPLHYYFMMTAYRLGGASAFTARLGSGLLAVLTVALVFAWCRVRFGEGTALWSSMVLLSSLHFGLQFQLATPDPYLIFFVTLGTILIFEGAAHSSRAMLYAGYASAGLACLAKGPVGIILPAGALGLAWILGSGFKFAILKKYRPVTGTLVLLAISVPWYIAVHIATDGAFTEGFFIKHNISRYSEPMEGHGGFFLIMPLLFWLAFIPFTGISIQAFAKWWQQRKLQPALLLAGCAALFAVIFFSFSGTKLPSYISPALPFGAIVIGCYVNELVEGKRVIRKAVWIIPILLGVCIAAGATYAISLDENIGSMTWLGLAFIPLPVGSLAAYVYLKRNKPALGMYAACAGAILTIALVKWVAWPAADTQNPVRLSAAQTEGKTVVAWKRFNPSYVWHHGAPVQIFYDPNDLRGFVGTHSDLVILSTTRNEAELRDSLQYIRIFSGKDLFENPVSVVYRPNKE